MKIEELFPNCQQDDYFDPPSYTSIINALCDTILVIHSDSGWDGSTYAYVKLGDQYGYLEFGWGSCSGCDALQACESYKDLEELFLSFKQSINWFNSELEFLSWFNQHDWQGSFSWQDGGQEFCKKINNHFNLR